MANKKNSQKAQEIQDKIFKKMSASEKIRIASELTMLCLKLNHLNGKRRSRKTFS